MSPATRRAGAIPIHDLAYVCQSIMKHGKDACDSPRLNARRFEEMVVGKIRSNVLTEGNIRAPVKVVDEQMDGVAREQRKRLETIAAYALDMSEFLNECELTERRAFIETFVKEIVVMPGDALLRYTIPISQSTPKTQLLLGGRSEELWVSNEAEASSQLVWDVERRLSPAGNWHHTIIMDGSGP